MLNSTGNNRKPSIVLLSGGLDSATTLAISLEMGFAPYTLSFDYGQRHSGELEAARKISAKAGAVQHLITKIDLRTFGKSALTSEIAVPKGRNQNEIDTGIPVTYVPARNTIFLSFALAYAEAIESSDIFIGVNALDYSGYPDCRPEFIDSFERMANLATKAAVEGRTKVKIHAPLMQMTKAQIIQRGLKLAVDYSLTLTCYDPDENNAACGTCDSCILRLKGFAENGIPDPVKYQIKR
ncbi:MAG: 7-cyano-7-deazaguanine synthase QueC [Candidatus Riflebacteria bacterium]|nr:7-cyano-7-deazaguanine synthase QueC [Candidatus Riflebacteria bacterium]